MNKKQKKMLLRIVISAILAAGGIAFKDILSIVLYLTSYLVIGYDILKKAYKGILNRRPFDENFLMAVATVGAVALAIYERTYDFGEAVAVMLFYQIGELFQSCAVGRSRKSISALMDIRPDYANLEENGEVTKVSPYEVEIGNIIVVAPGEKVPIDGVVEEGISSLNTAALTGESLPMDVSSGDEVLSGSINLTGVLKIKTTKDFGESTVSKILELVDNSSMRKSRSESFISRFAKVYTPAVCFAALALCVIPPIIGLIVPHFDGSFGMWLYRALTFLVVSCPCALVISIPLSFFAGLGGASREGVLIKGSNYLEALSKVKVIAFDKTGTLTKGVFEVNGVHHNEIENEMILEYTALAEASSSHPIAKSLIRSCGKNIDKSRVSNVEEISGNGVTAVVDDKRIAVGNDKLMRELKIDYKDCHCVGTIVHIAIEDKYAGHIVISDIEKPGIKDVIKNLKKIGIKKTVMLTGDRKKAAEEVAKRIGIDSVCCELLPSDKVEEVEKLISNKKRGEYVAFVGDGINDAPVLSRADVGIAMGAIGSDAAVEAADIIIMDDDPSKISKAVKISRKCIGVVYQNIVFALGIKFACLILSAFGAADMRAAIFADVGVMVLAVLNAMRALKA